MSEAVVICPGNASEAQECVSTSPQLEQGKHGVLCRSVHTGGVLSILTLSPKLQGLVTITPLWFICPLDGWMLQLLLPEQDLWIPHCQVAWPYLEPFQGKSSPVFDLIVLFTHHTNWVRQREGQQDREDGLFA